MEGDSLFNKLLEQADIYRFKTPQNPTMLQPKLHVLKLIQNGPVIWKYKIIKLLEKNLGDNLQDLKLSKKCWDFMLLKHDPWKEKLIKWTSSKF